MGGTPVERPPAVRYGAARHAVLALQQEAARRTSGGARRAPSSAIRAAHRPRGRARGRARADRVRRRRVDEPRIAVRVARSIATATQPFPQIVAMRGSVRLQMPVMQSLTTAIGYHSRERRRPPLAPLGHQGNEGVVQRVFHAIFGGGADIRCGIGSTAARCRRSTSARRPARTSTRRSTGPSSASRRSSSRAITSARRSTSSRRTRRPLVVTLTQLRPDDALTVGDDVVSGRTKVGTDRRPLERRAPGARALHERRGQPRTRSKSDPPQRWFSTEDPLPRRCVRPARPARGRAAAAGPARRARRRRLHRQRREHRRRSRHHRQARRPLLAVRRGRRSRSATTRSAATASARTSTRARRVIRPANAGSHAPGRGLDGRRGAERREGRGDQPARPAVPRRAGLPVGDGRRSRRARRDAQAPVVVVDFHAEATSEKVAMAAGSTAASPR